MGKKRSRQGKISKAEDQSPLWGVRPYFPEREGTVVLKGAPVSEVPAT